LRHFAGGHPLGHRQAGTGCGGVGRAQGVAVHRGVGEGRHGHRRDQILGQYAPEGVGQIHDRSFVDRAGQGQQSGLGFIEGEHCHERGSP